MSYIVLACETVAGIDLCSDISLAHWQEYHWRALTYEFRRFSTCTTIHCTGHEDEEYGQVRCIDSELVHMRLMIRSKLIRS